MSAFEHQHFAISTSYTTIHNAEHIASIMSTEFENQIDTYYQDKETYTKLLSDPSTRKISDLDEKKKGSPVNGWDGSRTWFQREKTEPGQSTSKADFESLFDGKSAAEIQSGVDSVKKEGSMGKKTMPIMTKR